MTSNSEEKGAGSSWTDIFLVVDDYLSGFEFVDGVAGYRLRKRGLLRGIGVKNGIR